MTLQQLVDKRLDLVQRVASHGLFSLSEDEGRIVVSAFGLNPLRVGLIEWIDTHVMCQALVGFKPTGV